MVLCLAGWAIVSAAADAYTSLWSAPDFISSREVMREALRAFDGTLMIVSHDRWFLRLLSSRVIEIDDGSLRVCEGGCGEYLAR